MKTFFRQFKWFFEHYKKLYAIGVVFLLINYGLNMLPPRMVGRVSDAILAGQMSLPQLWRTIALMLLIILINYLACYIWGYVIYRASDDAALISHREIFARLLKQSPLFYAANSTGSIMGKATNDVSSVGEFLSFGMMAIFDSTVWPLALLFFMLAISWKLTLGSFLPLPLLIFFSRRIGTKLYTCYDEAQAAFDEMNESVLEGIAGIRVVRAYNLEESEKERFHSRADQLFRKNMRAVRYSQMYMPISRLVPAISLVIALALGISEIQAGHLTTGGLITFTFYLNMLIWPMMAIGESINTGEMGSASMQRIQELMDQPLAVTDSPTAMAMPDGASIKVSDLHFSYGSKTKNPALEDIHFELGAGQSLGLVGPVGSGKTTLLRQFLHFYPLPEGQIEFGGRDLARIRRAELHHAIAYVPQNSFLFSRSIRDNILLGASDEDLASGRAETRLQEVLDIADLRKDLPQLPQGLDSQAGEKGIALSGGQKQRICIARALMKEDSPLLILDDCLSAVDAMTEKHILDALKRERQGKSTLIAAHRLSAVRSADLILVLQEGRIVDRGTHAELLAHGGWYAEQYKQQELAEGGKKNE